MERHDDDEIGKLGGQLDAADESAVIRRWLKLARRVIGGGEDEKKSADRGHGGQR